MLVQQQDMLKIAALLVLFCSLADGCWAQGQYGIGPRYGPIIWIVPGNARTSAIAQNRSAHSIGIILQQVNHEGNGFRFGLERVTRSFDLDLLNGITNRREILEMRTVLLQFSSEIRFKIEGSRGFFFDMGPVIGAQLAEMRTGVAFYDHPGQEDPQYVNGLVERGFEIRDFRWRFGFSKDVPLADRLLMTVHASASPGFSAWFRDRGFMTADLQLAVGLVYSPGNAVRKAPRMIPDPIG